jgi:hypothetical protein
VYKFFPNGRYVSVRRWVKVEDAAKIASDTIKSQEAGDGRIVKVIITDGGDCTVLEWNFGLGVVWPPIVREASNIH